MGALHRLFVLSLLSSVEAYYTNGTSNGTSHEKISWGACPEDLKYHQGYQCGTLSVPRDYTANNDTRTIQLELLKVPATKQPSKGSILLNLGGPGEPNREGLNIAGWFYSGMSGGEYDMITFDSRGSVNTLPFTCLTTDLEKLAYTADNLFPGSSDVENGWLWARGQADSATCASRMRETGELISTAFGARDLMSTVDALGEDGMLRYWGISYGTTLGATVAAMFPDRIDMMLLDAVQNPHEYYHSQAAYEQWIHADEHFSAMFEYCVKAGNKCALATGNLTAKQLEQTVLEFIDSIRRQPVYLPGVLRPVDYSAIKAIIINGMYGQGKWAATLATLAQFMAPSSQVSAPSQESQQGSENATDLFPTLDLQWWLRGIQCGDSFVRTDSLKDFLPAVEKLWESSQVIGENFGSVYALCNQWAITPKERYGGDFNVKTKNPVLMVGGSYDALTAIDSARNLSATFEGSAVLEWDGYGHGTLAVASRCTYEAITAYWQNLSLPEEGKVCQSDSVPFSGVTWPDILPDAFPLNKTTN